MARLRCDFDLLLQGLSAALLEAQRRCRARHERALRACFGAAETVQVVTQEAEPPALQIPLWELRAWQLPQIGELALSFDVELEVVEMPDEAPRLLLQVSPRRPRRPGHRLQILFRGTHTPVGEVLFDGQQLKLWHLSEPATPHDPDQETAHA